MISVVVWNGGKSRRNPIYKRLKEEKLTERYRWRDLLWGQKSSILRPSEKTLKEMPSEK